MKVITGKYKGKILKTRPGLNIRPTGARIKETLFNLLPTNFEDKIVLDLFSGTGALGIEALSRGAKKVYFVDSSKKALLLIKENLQNIEDNYELIHLDSAAALFKITKKVDFIFADPPYDYDKHELLLSKILESNILNQSGSIIIEKRKSTKIFTLPMGLYLHSFKNVAQSTLEIIKLGHCVMIPGTFDPITTGHEFLIKQALEEFSFVKIVILENPDKKPLYTINQRLQFIKQIIRKYDNTQADYYKGLTIDYAKKHSIRYLIRGVRDNKDFEYEQKMAKWNKENGNIDTLFFYAKDKLISSSLIKTQLGTK